MLIRTHLAITLFFVLLLLPYVNDKAILFGVAILSTLIADVDYEFSTLGKRKIFRPLQMFLKHRGFLHSFTFLFIATLLIVLFFPKIALGFFLGYSLHLFADSFTIKGIKPFYPFGRTASRGIKSGNRKDTALFVAFIAGSLLLAVRYLSKFV